MNIKILKDYEAISEAAFNVMKNIVVEKENAVLGLATGSSPIRMYELMIKDHQNNHTDYSKCSTYNLDEYVGIDRDHSQSYWTFMHENLFHGLNIGERNIHVPYGNNAADCAGYEKAMENVQVDIQVLGIGANGHIGFNEPGTPFNEETHIVELTQKTREDNARFFDDDINKVPTQAITMGIATIMKAKKILLVASGANKADAVYAMIKGEIDPMCPASVLQNHSNVDIFIDEAAGSKL